VCTLKRIRAAASKAGFGISASLAAAPIFCERNMDKLIVLGFLIAATTLEAIGDAIVRVGLGQSSFTLRCLLFVVGATFLFGYGLSLNLAPVEFSRVVGLYIATLFVVRQLLLRLDERAPRGGCARPGDGSVLALRDR
jgi:small multidrug resistance family-3 protein